jgi:hypothetical protein
LFFYKKQILSYDVYPEIKIWGRFINNFLKNLIIGYYQLGVK